MKEIIIKWTTRVLALISGLVLVLSYILGLTELIPSHHAENLEMIFGAFTSFLISTEVWLQKLLAKLKSNKDLKKEGY